MTETVTTYEPDNCLKKGYLGLFKEIYNEIKDNKWLIYQLFKRDFFATYKQSFFGILWAFIIPLVSVGTFLVLSESGLLVIGSSGVPYPLFAMFSLAIWQLFASGLVAGSTSLVRAGSMIVKINFSKKALVISSLGQTMISFVIQMSLALGLYGYYAVAFGLVPNVAILLVPVLILPMLLFTLGLSFIMSILNGVLRDIGNLLPLVTTFLMFLTPVMYAAPKTGILGLVTTYNPLYYLVALPRDLAFTGTSTLWPGFLISSALSVGVFVVCLVAFHLTETRLAERV